MIKNLETLEPSLREMESLTNAIALMTARSKDGNVSVEFSILLNRLVKLSTEQMYFNHAILNSLIEMENKKKSFLSKFWKGLWRRSCYDA